MPTKIIKPDATRVSLPRNFKVLPYKTYFSTSFDKLSDTEKRLVLKEAEEYNTSKDKIKEFYNSGRLHPLLYSKYNDAKHTYGNTRYTIIVPGRLKDNDSKFEPEKSEKLEDASNSYL